MLHYVMFMIVGLIAFAVDASILSGLTNLIGIPALVARIFNRAHAPGQERRMFRIQYVEAQSAPHVNSSVS
jgi:hypothetical protein